MSVPVIIARSREDAEFYAALIDVKQFHAVSTVEQLDGLDPSGGVYFTSKFEETAREDTSAKVMRLAVERWQARTKTTQAQIPTVSRMVHYQSYGTPGGEYLPEPRAAIITEVQVVGDVKAILDRGWVLAGTHGDGVHLAMTPDGKYIPREETPTTFRVYLAVINPTGIHFNQGPKGEGVPYADVPTPGHWNWPPRA